MKAAEEELKAEGSAAGASGAAAAAGGKKKTSPAEIRVRKDMQDLDLPPMCTLTEIDPTNFEVLIDLKDMESIWKGGKYKFQISIPKEYPIKPPKTKLETPIYHPNIDLEGNVCLNILKDDWKPVGDLNLVVNGLLFLFLEPNPEDPLNHEAAAEFRDQEYRFKQNVAKTLRGEYFQGRHYPKFK